MSQAPTDGINLLDPWGFWKSTRDTNLEAWSKFMIDIVNSDEYAKATGLALENALTTSQPFRDALERTMTQNLSMLNMPSRAEVISVAERLVNVEMRLDDMDAKLTAVQNTLQEAFKETIQHAMTAQNRHLKDIETKVEKAGTDYAGIEDVVKEAIRQAMATPSRHIKEIEAHIEEVDSKLKALQVPNGATPEAKAAHRPEPKPQAKPEVKREAGPAQPTAKKEQEAR